MNPVPETNGHTVGSVRDRGGYDAYFTPVAEAAAPGVEQGRHPEQAPQPGAVAPSPAAPPSGDGATTASAPPASSAAPVSPRPSAAPREGRPQPDGGSSAAAPPGTAQSSTPPSGHDNAAGAPPEPPSGASVGGETYTGFDDLRETGQRKGTAAVGHENKPVPDPIGMRQPQSGGNAVGRPDAPAATPPPTAPTPPSTAGPTPGTAAGAAGPANSAVWNTPAAQHRYPATGDGRSATWQPAPPPGSQLPDRLGQAEAAARVEVLPATLTSMDLLADITAARRAQLKSTSGMRGALNKVGFNLGLSPAEQRTEERRARIRRQLNDPYQIAVISVKGGVGRTTVAATLGSTFAVLRPDRVVGVDANPDFGDLPARTAPHPYGLTLRDMALANDLDAFSAVHSFTSINNSDLAVVASPWSTEASEALSGGEYNTAAATLRRHYNLLIADCGTGVLDSITQTVLRTSDAVVVVTPPTVGGVKGAVATLNWLNSHGLQHLIASSVIAIVHQHPVKPTVDVEQIEKLFATAGRPTRVLPYDEHLAEGGEIDLRLLDKDTALAFEDLAAGLGDGFPGQGRTADRGGRR